MDCDLLDWFPKESDYLPTQIVQIKIENTVNNEQLLDTELDDQDQKFVDRNYRRGGKKNDVVVSCANCFTPISYQARLGAGGYHSDVAINIQHIKQDQDPASTNLKRNRKPSLAVACESCSEIIATQDKSGIFYFTQVIPSSN